MRLGLDGSPLLEIKTGVGRYTYELATALSRSSFDLEMFYYYGTSWSRKISSIDASGVISTSGNVLSKWRILPIGLRKLFPRVLKDFLKPKIFKHGYSRNQLDIYHATNYVAPDIDMPLVVTVYDLSFIRYPETHPADRLAWLRKGFEATIRNADQIITISEFSKNEIIELLGLSQSKITIAYPGVDSRLRPLNPDHLAPLLKAWSLNPGGYILSVGTLEPRKNLITLFKAYELLPDEIKKNWPLVVVGMTGWKEKAIMREMDGLIRKGNLVPLGYLTDEQLAIIYAGAKIFVYPSLYEGFGMPPLEAMACGIPVVCSNQASLPEAVGPAGVMVHPEDVPALAEVLESVLADSQKSKEMSRMGLQQAAKFTWRACGEKTFGVYQKALYQ
jgi:alpha-1,3-rhamnosyl/mannosyltransferase